MVLSYECNIDAMNEKAPMSLPREDPRWTRSRAALIEAMTALVDSGHIPTITDVVARAGVSRPTFYQHFGDLSTALSTAALERIEAQFAVIPPSFDSVDLESTRATVTALLTHLQEHGGFYRAVLNDSRARHFTASVVEFVAHRIVAVSPLRVDRVEKVTAPTADRTTVLAAGLVWLITEWLTRADDEAESIEEISRRLVAVLAFFARASIAVPGSSARSDNPGAVDAQHSVVDPRKV